MSALHDKAIALLGAKAESPTRALSMVLSMPRDELVGMVWTLLGAVNSDRTAVELWPREFAFDWTAEQQRRHRDDLLAALPREGE